MPPSDVIRYEFGPSMEPFKIKLEKNSRGYNYEISVAGNDLNQILERIEVIDAKLRKKYGQEAG